MQLDQAWVHGTMSRVFLGLAHIYKASTDTSARGEVRPCPVLLQVCGTLITYQLQGPGAKWCN